MSKFQVTVATLNASGDASVLSANAFAVTEFESPNDFHVGFGAEAQVANASGSVGVLEVPTTNGGTTNLFAIHGGASAGSVGAGGNISSVNVYSNDVISINVVTIDAGLAAGLGLNFGFSVPTFRLNFPPRRW